MWWIGPIKRELVCGGKIRDIVCAIRWNVVNKLQISWPQKGVNKCQKVRLPESLLISSRFQSSPAMAVVTTLFEFAACICSEEIGMAFTTVIQNHQREFAGKAYLKFRKILILPAIWSRKKEVRARDAAWSLTRSGALGTARSDWRSVPKTVEQKHSTSPRSPLLFWEIGVFTVLKELRECWEENLHKSSHEYSKRY